MADRIVVMNQGVVEQVGTPQEIYHQPATPFVADFVGHMTFIDAVVTGPQSVRIDNLDLVVEHDDALANGTPVRVAMRPEEVRTRLLTGQTLNRFEAVVGELSFLGAFCRASLTPVASPNTRIAADFSANAMRDLGIRAGQTMTVALPPESLHVFVGAAR